jgi:uncharacterized protein
MKNRDDYLKQLINFKDKSLIKVITGIRRCGKSSLLTLFEEYLLKNNVRQDEIIRINFESFEFDQINEYKQLYIYIKDKITSRSKKHYILLDEIQQVKNWEKAVNSLLVDYNVDIYITGSNAYLLSSELATYLSGRYVEIKMQPLSFKEYLDFLNYKIDKNDPKLETLFNQYLKYGGLPTVIELLDNTETIDAFLNGIYNTVIMKDVIQRNEVRDVVLLDSLIKFLASNIGSIVSMKKISDYLTSSGRKTSSITIENYIKMLENAYIIYSVKRYDLKGKQILKSLGKYYIVDTGIRTQLTGLRNTDYGHILENVVYFELLRRGYEVSIGKSDKLEIDFIATKYDEKIYIQVSASVMDESVKARELKPLLTTQDAYPKLILTMDRLLYNDLEGVKITNIIDFLLNI